MSKIYNSAYILGKFLPFTKGHKLLIDTALQKSGKVTVLVCSLEREPIPGDIRFHWAKKIYHNEPRVEIIHCTEELPQYPEEHPDFWKIWVDVVKRYCPNDIDVIFTSELYGETYAKHLGIKHHMVDLERQIVPISGTKARTEPFEHWNYLPHEVKQYFVKRIAIMGPESVGKSTLTKKLASYYNTNFVEEYGRTVYENNGNKVTIDDFIPISKGRQDLENWISQHSNRVIFCDTEDLTTYIFSKMYCPNDYKTTERYFINALNTKKKYDLYLLLKPDCDAVQDGTRNFLEERWNHYNILKEEMINRGYEFIELGGSWDDRTEDAKFIISDKFNINIKKIYHQ
jgi:HTH-type transcriptional repressor of NAD biosynthesis genes